MLDCNPNNRPSAEEILLNPAVQKYIDTSPGFEKSVTLRKKDSVGKHLNIQNGEISAKPGTPKLLDPNNKSNSALSFGISCYSGEMKPGQLKVKQRKSQYLQVIGKNSFEDLKYNGERRPSFSSISSSSKTPSKIFRSFTPGYTQDREIPLFNPFPNGNLQKLNETKLKCDEDFISEEIEETSKNQRKYFSFLYCN